MTITPKYELHSFGDSKFAGTCSECGTTSPPFTSAGMVSGWAAWHDCAFRTSPAKVADRGTPGRVDRMAASGPVRVAADSSHRPGRRSTVFSQAVNVLVFAFLFFVLVFGAVFVERSAALGHQEDSDQSDWVCISPNVKFIHGQTVGSVELPFVLAAGTYDVAIRTSDAYDTREATPATGQTSERVTVLGVTTNELADNVAEAHAKTYGTVVLPAPISTVTASHSHAGGPDSVLLVSVCVSLVPAPTTTTMPAPTTTAAPTTTMPDQPVPTFGPVPTVPEPTTSTTIVGDAVLPTTSEPQLGPAPTIQEPAKLTTLPVTGAVTDYLILFGVGTFILGIIIITTLAILGGSIDDVVEDVVSERDDNE